MNSTPRIRSWFIGSESLLVQCVEMARAHGHDVLGVVTDSEDVRGWARGSGVRVIAPGREARQALAAEPFDYLFSITWLRVIADDLLALPGRAAINFHDGPLPRYAGLNAPSWALLAGESRFGISWHEIAGGVDEGPIHLQHEFDIPPGETALGLNTLCFQAAIQTFPALLERLDAGTPAVPQDLSERSYFGKQDRPAAAATLDWSRPAAELEALVRALDYGPRYPNPLGVAKLRTADAVVRVASARLVEAEGAPGEILEVGESSVTIACADGALEVGGLEHLDARPLDPRSILQAGDRLPGLDASLSARLDECARRWAAAEDFWRRGLASLEPVELPHTGSPAESSAPDCRRAPVALPSAFDTRFADRSALISAFGAFLRRVSSRDSLDVAYVDPRLAAEVEGVESYASPHVPMRVAVGPGVPLAEAIEALNRQQELLASRGPLPLELIARTPSLRDRPELQEGRLLPVGAGRYHDAGEAQLQPGEVLRLAVPDSGSALWLHDARALDEAGAAALRRQFETFLAAACEAPDTPVGQLDILDAGERQRLLVDWNATATDYPRERCVHELIREQARATPGAVAVCHGDEQLTYAELDARTDQLAAFLQGAGVGPDVLVGVFVDRSIEMVLAIVGVLKAGGAYVPLDPTYPRDRIAFMVEDSGVRVLLTRASLEPELPAGGARVVRLDEDWAEIERAHPDALRAGARPDHLAYVIYTSGSTGKPKGVMVEHRNVVNFFAGMDERVPHDPPGSWLAVTSLSFDISVLELLWTLARGFRVVVYADDERRSAEQQARSRPLDFGLFLWGNDDGPGARKYQLMLEAARFADENGFSSISTPERHFHAFGGPYPNPSVTSAAIAAVTSRIQIRAGSCVLPLHHPIRVAEDWAVVDNISSGRVAISFAAGWQPNDFVIRPEAFENAKGRMFDDVERVRALWRGEAIEFDNPLGQSVATRTLPRPVQPELPTWITTAGNVETYRMAGERGYNVLTHLLGQTVEEVAEKVVAYRRAREQAGHDPAAGRITLMLHTFVGEDDEEVKELVREPMKDYLRSSVNLVKGFAWAFPAFKRPPGKENSPDDIDLDALSEEEMDAILDFAFERYYETSGLFGTPETCVKMLDRVRAAGVDEIACLIDYGVPTGDVLSGLKLLARVREEAFRPAGAETATDMSLAAQVERHGITHLQCTPSMARMMTLNPDMRRALGRVSHLMIGGEAFPTSLARELETLVTGSITNMYGPTETTIWSSTQVVEGAPDSIPIGTPIANTRLYIVDPQLQPTPVGVPGELLIGGDGVVRGYHERPELTAERFIEDPFSERPGDRLYRTGDLARWRADGVIEFLGRMDHQIKLRGYRVELGEIETLLGREKGVGDCVVVAREDTPGDVRLVAYIVAEGDAPSPDALRTGLRSSLPEFMIPGTFAFLDRFPLTPNGKVDRKALPAPDQVARGGSSAAFAPPANALEETVAATWQEVLGLDAVGRDDNFFDLGGHSLLVVQVHRLLTERLEKRVGLTDLYRFPTIRTLVEHLEGGDDGLERSRDRAAARRESMKRRLGQRGRRGRGKRS